MAGKGKRNKELLTQQTAAILAFLRGKDLEKAASKLKRQLEKEGFKFPDEDDDLEGRWEWVEEEDEEEDSSSEEESDSDDDESETEEASSEEEEEEEESEDESEEEKEPPNKSKKKKGKSDGITTAGKGKSDTDAKDNFSSTSATPSEVPNKKGFGRSVSFSDDVEERTLSPWKKGLKKELFFSKSELRQFKMEAQEEKLKEQMAQASAAFGVTLPGI